MQCSLLSKLNLTRNHKPLIIKIITWFFRLATGGTFLLSGFVKSVDPWGTFYKFEEYASALGLEFLHALILPGVIALCTVEFLIGVFFIFGCYRKSNPVVALAMMAFMLPLTLWIAVSNPVNDCGCFGDALLLSNWATFWKNIVLTVMIVWLVKYNITLLSIISPAFQWLSVVASIAFIGSIAYFGYFVQPLIDFRPYHVGSELISDRETDDTANYVFIYEKNGEKREFGENDELPSEDDGWEYIERKEINWGNHNTNDQEKTLRIWDYNGEDDVTEEIEWNEGEKIVLMIPSLSDISPATTWRINALCDWSRKSGIEMFAIVSGSTDDIRNWEDVSMPQYVIYTADDTAIKEVVRGNPGIVYLSNGNIKWKRTLSSIDVSKLVADERLASPDTLNLELDSMLLSLFYIYIVILAFIVSLSMAPRIKSLYLRRK